MKVTPNAKDLILGLLLAADGAPLSSRDAVLACQLFEISENSVRVALVRLSVAGLVAGAGRGTYQLGPNARSLAADVATWRNAEQRLRDWTGGYVMVHCGALGRSDRVALRQRDRALQLLGLRELEKGLFIRPDNLSGGVAAIRQRLYGLGLETDASVFLASGFDAATEQRISQLWDGTALNSAYIRNTQELNDWLARAAQLEADVAAREAYLLGSRGIRHIVFDPLLPTPLVDVDARHQFFQAVQQFDQAGHAIWLRFFSSAAGSANDNPQASAWTAPAVTTGERHH